MKTGIELIAEERSEQIKKHGYDDDNDRDNSMEELKQGALYALTLDKDFYPKTWAFWFHDKMKAKEVRLSEHEFAIEQLKIAGALCAAEIDRLNEGLEDDGVKN